MLLFYHQERKLAQIHDYEDPVNPTYEATTEMYYQVSDLFLDRLKDYTQQGEIDRLQLTFATHNADTVLYVLNGWVGGVFQSVGGA